MHNKITLIGFLLVVANIANAVVFPHSDVLKQKLLTAYNAQPDTYIPRTQYLCKSKYPCFTNRLILEKSPYLLQHAHNPVDWYAWGDEALAKAKRENKPIFLSIGYAACHWCHVMEKESFDNREIAEILNRHFVAIKVDREQRPDIDNLFANAVMIFKGQQGWPMSVFLTPQAMPFDGGGYYDPHDFKNILQEVSAYWDKHQKEAITRAQSVIDEIQGEHSVPTGSLKLNDALRLKAIKNIMSIVDSDQGGFGESEKFPREPWLYLLLNDSLGQNTEYDSLKTLTLSLSKMARGGIYDQLAGGFHRYTTDPYWKVPHYEKMLYNQALLIPLYLNMMRLQPDPLYTRIARETSDFMLKDMRDSNGGFYSSIDAESDGIEGSYYLWSIDEWNKSINDDDKDFASLLYDVDEYGETETNQNVLYLSESIHEYAEHLNQDVEVIHKRINTIRAKLLKVRQQRKPPALDKKIIMSWNSMAITALSESALYFDDERYLNAATKAANFIWDKLLVNKQFYRIYLDGSASQVAILEDYAGYLQATLKLYDVTRNKLWLNRAIIIADAMILIFWDADRGGFYDVPQDYKSPLPIRTKTSFDKTLVSANAIAIQSLLRLYKRTGNEAYKDSAESALLAFYAEVADVPSAYAGLLVATTHMLKGENNLPAYAARGHVRVDAKLIRRNSLTGNGDKLQIDLNIDDEWHINSSSPLDKTLIATRVDLAQGSVWTMLNARYPDHKVLKTGFSKTSLALYTDKIQITSNLSQNDAVVNPVVQLTLQACNDRLCLPPEELRFNPRLIDLD